MSSTSTIPARLTETGFCSWVGEAESGDIVEYHRGFLGIDIQLGPTTERKALGRLARRAAWAFDQGLVHLVQRRNGPFDFSYLAIRRPRPRTARSAKRKPEHPVTREPELEELA